MRRMRLIVGSLMVATLLVGAAVAQEEYAVPENVCGLEFVACSTGIESECVAGTGDLDGGCVARCRKAYDDCLREQRNDPEAWRRRVERLQTHPPQ